ncbi:hypothetical protein [Janibacter cremeus]|uniref:Uncharacterized protein n=1 Tax=Janibacter cremeus TaxID=1285192 RepID=A0A852VX01_9MICO|nr:hypothetical protein [Janibacter cremeus]NYF99183.1 hypothetical protein [Janibacter cremeus]
MSVAAHRALFISLINDASLFPPAQLPMDQALRAHAAHRRAGYADVVGPFLLGVPAVEDLTRAMDTGAPVPPAIGLVARPGTAVADIDASLGALRALGRPRVVSLDAAWSPEWRNLDFGELVVNLEIGREGQGEALDDITSASDFVDVRAKFRTGPTPGWSWPGAAELADVILATGRRHLPLTLTGGMHHVVRGEYLVDATPQEQHGLLNVLVAVHASAGGVDATTVRDLLEIRDASALADSVAGWSSPDIAAVRAAFTGYGCCDVTDPIGELQELGLLTVGEE